jgi:hypothetical protein
MESRRQQVAWNGIPPCWIQYLDFDFDLDFDFEEHDKRLTNGRFDSAFDAAEPVLKNWEDNASGRAVGHKIDPFPRSFRFTTESWTMNLQERTPTPSLNID